MRYVLAAVALGLLLGSVSLSEASHLNCHTGNTLGFVSIRADPQHIVGTLPGRFTSDPDYFDIRFNCTRRSVQARRVDEGMYEVRFPGVNVRVAIASAVSSEGVTASVQPLTDGIVRISLRGPLSGDDVAARRDVPFSVVVY